MCQPMQSTLYDWFHLILTKFYEVGAITVIPVLQWQIKEGRFICLHTAAKW